MLDDFHRLKLFRLATPVAGNLRLMLTLDNMSVEGKPALLSTGPDSRQIMHMFGVTKPAPGPKVTSEITTTFSDIESGVAAYKLLGGLYAQFGFDYAEMPYLDEDGGRITPKSLLGEDWKED